MTKPPFGTISVRVNPPRKVSTFVRAPGKACAQATREQRQMGHAPGTGRAAGSEVSAIGSSF